MQFFFCNDLYGIAWIDSVSIVGNQLISIFGLRQSCWWDLELSETQVHGNPVEKLPPICLFVFFKKICLVLRSLSWRACLI